MKVRLPELVRQFCAEVLGTFLLVLFGDGAIAQVVLGKHNNFECAYCRKKYWMLLKIRSLNQSVHIHNLR